MVGLIQSHLGRAAGQQGLSPRPRQQGIDRFPRFTRRRRGNVRRGLGQQAREAGLGGGGVGAGRLEPPLDQVQPTAVGQRQCLEQVQLGAAASRLDRLVGKIDRRVEAPQRLAPAALRDQRQPFPSIAGDQGLEHLGIFTGTLGGEPPTLELQHPHGLVIAFDRRVVVTPHPAGISRLQLGQGRQGFVGLPPPRVRQQLAVKLGQLTRHRLFERCRGGFILKRFARQQVAHPPQRGHRLPQSGLVAIDQQVGLLLVVLQFEVAGCEIVQSPPTGQPPAQQSEQGHGRPQRADRGLGHPASQPAQHARPAGLDHFPRQHVEQVVPQRAGCLIAVRRVLFETAIQHLHQRRGEAGNQLADRDVRGPHHAPGQFGGVGARKRGPPREQFIQQHPHRPDIFAQFGRAVGGAPALGGHCCQASPRLRPGSRRGDGESSQAGRLPGRSLDLDRLQVEVPHAHIVGGGQSCGHLGDQFRRLAVRPGPTPQGIGQRRSLLASPQLVGNPLDSPHLLDWTQVGVAECRETLEIAIDRLRLDRCRAQGGQPVQLQENLFLGTGTSPREQRSPRDRPPGRLEVARLPGRGEFQALGERGGVGGGHPSGIRK